ncbi:MAG: YceD family protein [Streptosporangiaceae bacterium]
MPHARSAHAQRLDPRRPLVFDTRTLGPGEAQSLTRTAPAPADLGAGLAGVPEGAELELAVQLEGVSEGVLATVTVNAPLEGECARCLEQFTATTTVTFQELFSYDADAAGPDGYVLDGDLLDLEPALRDALVLELPLSPLCTPDCAGLCPECGVRLADAGPGHGHEPEDGGVWGVLRQLQPGGEEGPDTEDGAAAPDDTNPGGSAAPDRAKEQ